MELRSTRDFMVAGRWALPMAATGAILAVRRAGSQAASMVTTTPMTRAVRTVAGAMISGPAGIFALKSSIAERMATARPTPQARPMTEEMAPTTAASARTERLTWPRWAPTARSRASSRVRWATSIVKVL